MMGDISFRKAAWFVVAVALMHTFVVAQTPDRSVYLGAYYQMMQPRGEFKRNLTPTSWKDQLGFGFDLTFPFLPVHPKVPRIMRSGLLNLRLDYLGCHYKAPPCEYCDGYYFRAISVGPELLLLRGPVRPYLNAAYGRISFESQTDFYSSGNQDRTHGTNALIYGGGVRIEMSKIGYSEKWTLDLDLGFRSYSAEPVSYQYQSDLTAATFDIARSRTPFFMYTIGLQFRRKLAE